MLVIEKISYLIEAIEQNTLDKESLLYQFIDSSHVKEELKIEALEYLVLHHHLDINSINTPLNIIEQTFRMDKIVLFKALIRFGGKVNYSIARDIRNHLSTEDLKEISLHLIKNHKQELENFYLIFLDFDGYKTYIKNSSTCDDKGVLIALSKNTFISSKEKIELTKLTLSKGAKINEQSKEGYRENFLYLYFKESKNITIDDIFLNFLIDNGANIQGENFSLLFDAIHQNNYQFVEYLLLKGADTLYTDKKHSLPHNIFYALVDPKGSYENDEQRIKVLKLLVKAGFNIQNSIEYYEVKNANVMIENIFAICGIHFIRHLLNTLAYTQLEKQLLRYSLQKNISFEIQKELISLNPSIILQEAYSELRDEYQEYGILECAVVFENEKITNFILDSFKKIKTYNEIYPLGLHAIKNGFSFETVKRLIKVETNINRLYYIEPKHPCLATMAVLLIYEYPLFKKLLNEDEIMELLELMSICGADFSIPLQDIRPCKLFMDKEHIIYLHGNSCHSFERNIVEFFYQNGLDFTTPISNTNESPLHSIIKKASDDIALSYLKFLNEKNVPLNLEHTNSVNNTMFLTAAFEHKPKTLKYLVELGANTQAKSEEYTALSLAAIDNSKDTIELLVDIGCDIKSTLISLENRNDINMEHIIRLRYHLYRQSNIKDENQGCLEIIDVLSYQDMERFKKLTKEKQNISFKNLIYCYAKDKYFDCSVLELAVMFNKEQFVLYILDNFQEIQTYSHVIPFLFWAINYQFSLETLKKLLYADTNINQKYFSKGNDEILIENMATQFIRIYSNKYDEQKRIEILKLMVQNGLKLSITDLITIISNYYMSDEKIFTFLKFLDNKGFHIDLEYKEMDENDIFLTICKLNKPLCMPWLIDKCKLHDYLVNEK